MTVACASSSPRATAPPTIPLAPNTKTRLPARAVMLVPAGMASDAHPQQNSRPPSHGSDRLGPASPCRSGSSCPHQPAVVHASRKACPACRASEDTHAPTHTPTLEPDEFHALASRYSDIQALADECAARSAWLMPSCWRRAASRFSVQTASWSSASLDGSWALYGCSRFCEKARSPSAPRTWGRAG